MTGCPHCYNSLKYEYPQFGGNFEVIHHTQFLLDLISSGKIKVGDELLDVVTEGEFIEKGIPVKVIQIEGSRIIVVKDENKSNNPKI